MYIVHVITTHSVLGHALCYYYVPLTKNHHIENDDLIVNADLEYCLYCQIIDLTCSYACMSIGILVSRSCV